LLVPGTPTKVK